MEKLLNLDKELTISELCVQFSCTIIKEFAENIWLKYKQLHPALSDNNHPLYIVMSVYTACKYENYFPYSYINMQNFICNFALLSNWLIFQIEES